MTTKGNLMSTEQTSTDTTTSARFYGLAFAVLALGVTTTGHDAPVPQRQQQVRFEVVGYGNNV